MNRAVHGLQNGITTPIPLPAQGPLHSLRLIAVALTAAALLVWVFIHADSVSIAEHQRYAYELRSIRQVDKEVDALLLATRLNLQPNFDALTLQTRHLSDNSQQLTDIPKFLPAPEAHTLLNLATELQRLIARKIEHIEQFKSDTAVLRNSSSYFPAAVSELTPLLGTDTPAARQLATLLAEVMTHAVNGGTERAVSIRTLITELERNAATLPPNTAERLRSALAHASLLTGRKPAMESLIQETLGLPTAEIAEQLVEHYAAAYEQANRHAHHYRLILLVLALGLAAYLVLLFLRLGRTRNALMQANAALNERIEVQRRSEEELKRYATVFTRAAEGMVITDQRGQVIAVNPAFAEITGYTNAEMVGRSPSILSSGRQPPSFYREMWRKLDTDGQWQGEIWNRRKNGEIYPEWLSITAVRGPDGKPTHYIGLFSDITERKQSEARIHHLSYHDALTNLPNRMLLQDRMQQAIQQAKRVGCHLAVLFLNLDRFKAINDSLGHERGDALLQQVAVRCREALRDVDTLSRPGADEFVFILQDLQNPQDAANVARKLLNIIECPLLLGEHQISVTGSMGIAVYDGDGSTPAELLRNAETAMRRAKQEGRNGFQFYAQDMNRTSLGDLLLENQLRGAIERGELELHYQPKVCAQSGQLESAEALLRWRHPELGLIAPGRFIPVAEESGLIVVIGEWVIRETCRQLAAWSEAGLNPVPIAVNLSAQQLCQPELTTQVAQALAKSGVSANLLEFELTETMLMRDIDRSLSTLGHLREMGVSLAIDDFGTGYSSLSYLQQFQVQVLKIDRSFVNDIRVRGADGKIAAAIIALAHSLGIKVVAEGVETEAQHRFLTRHGCDLLQGYLFSRPQPAASFAQQLATQHSGARLLSTSIP